MRPIFQLKIRNMCHSLGTFPEVTYILDSFVKHLEISLVRTMQLYSAFHALSNGVVFISSAWTQKFDPIDSKHRSEIKELEYFFVRVFHGKVFLNSERTSIENENCSSVGSQSYDSEKETRCQNPPHRGFVSSQVLYFASSRRCSTPSIF